MYLDQYLCTEIVICALHIWATVQTSPLESFRFEDENENDDPSPPFAHCAHAQIRDSDGVTTLLQSTFDVLA